MQAQVLVSRDGRFYLGGNGCPTVGCYLWRAVYKSALLSFYSMCKCGQLVENPVGTGSRVFFVHAIVRPHIMSVCRSNQLYLLDLCHCVTL